MLSGAQREVALAGAEGAAQAAQAVLSQEETRAACEHAQVSATRRKPRRGRTHEARIFVRNHL